MSEAELAGIEALALKNESYCMPLLALVDGLSRRRAWVESMLAVLALAVALGCGERSHPEFVVLTVVGGGSTIVRTADIESVDTGDEGTARVTIEYIVGNGTTLMRDIFVVESVSEIAALVGAARGP